MFKAPSFLLGEVKFLKFNTHIIKHRSTKNKNLKSWVQNPFSNFFWHYSELHKSQMGSLKTKWKRERMFYKTPCQRTSDCEVHDWRKKCPTVIPEFNAWSQPLSLDKGVQIQLTVSNFLFHLLHTCRNKNSRNPSFLHVAITGKPFIRSITHSLSLQSHMIL